MSHYHFDAIVDENRVSSTNPGMPVIDPQNMKFVQLKNAINKLTRIVDKEPFPQIIRMPDVLRLDGIFVKVTIAIYT